MIFMGEETYNGDEKFLHSFGQKTGGEETAWQTQV